MRTNTLSNVFVTIAALTAVPALAADAAPPQGVSPGSAVAAERLGTSCPTFSWTSVADAEGYELVVYRLPESGELVPMLEPIGFSAGSNWTTGNGNIAVGRGSFGSADESGVIRIGGMTIRTRRSSKGSTAPPSPTGSRFSSETTTY